MAIETRYVHFDLLAWIGEEAAGARITLTTPVLIDAGANAVLLPSSRTIECDENGEVTEELACNDSVGVSPEGWAYRVEIRGGQVITGSLAVPSGETTLEFADAFNPEEPAVVSADSLYATLGALAVEVAARAAADEAHAADTTSVHGIADTALLATDAELAAAITGLSTVYAALAGATFVGDVTIEDTGVKGYRLRRSGSGLDLDGSGADLFLSIFSGTAFNGTQRTYMRLESGAQLGHLVGPWVWAATPFGDALIEGAPSSTPGAATLGFFGAAPVTKPEVTGATTADQVASLIAAGAALGLWIDGT